MNLPVLFGGPVEQFRGFVLHSTDYLSNATSLPINDTVALTATVEILQAIARQRPIRSCGVGYSLGCGPLKRNPA